MSTKLKNYDPVKAAEIAVNIRLPFRPLRELTEVFKKEKPYRPELCDYFFEFFCELSPGFIKEYMRWADVSREQIIEVFNFLPNQPRKIAFKEALENGEF
jgi:hypothetical protein